MDNNLINNKNLGKLIQSGAIGLAILLIGLIAFMFNKYDQMATGHTVEFTAVIKENTKTQQELIHAINAWGFKIDEWGDQIDDLDNSIGKFMDYAAPYPPPYINR